MSTSPVMGITEELLAEIEEEIALCEPGYNAAIDPGHLAALLAHIVDLKQQLVAASVDTERLNAIEANCWDVRHDSHPIADTGDSSSSLEIVGHWMDEPRERVIGENYSEDLRAAIDQAMKAPAYPPARPEYEFDEFPDFGSGSGNRARRRAEALGIDYDAAMEASQ